MVYDQAFGLIPVLINNNHYQFLLIQHQGGHWGFPKGHAEAGESPAQSACREFEEETGITQYEVNEGVSLIEQYQFEVRGTQVDKRVTYFLAWIQPILMPPSPSEGHDLDFNVTVAPPVSIQLKEIQNYAWVNYEHGANLITFPAARQILHDAHEYLLQQKIDHSKLFYRNQ